MYKGDRASRSDAEIPYLLGAARDGNNLRRLLTTFLSATFLWSLCAPIALAAAASGNLTSTQATAAASAAATIRVGTHNLAIQPGQLLTPAESVALSQVLASGRQSLVLGAAGNAVGGLINITGQNLSNLVIPHGVKVLDNVATSSLNLSGDLTNSGSFYVYSTNSATATAFLTAADITNQKGGLLSSVVPASLLGGASAIPSLSLDLNAINNLINAGTIRSAGGISLTAGNSITNSGSVISGSVGDITLTSNQINNSGLINSVAGNLNINAANAGNIAVNNANGTLQALLGNINVRDASFTANANFDLTGGNVLSKELNINSGSGAVDVSTDKLTGVVSVTAGSASVLAATSDLQLGTMNITGDPTFFNTAGNVTIDSDLTGQDGAAVAIVASGNIVTGTGATGINTSSTSDDGGAITLIAGAKFTAATSGNPNTKGGDQAQQLTITGGSATGGKIDLISGGNMISSINSSSTVGNGGDVTIIAYKGTATGSGTIALGSPSVSNSAGAVIINATAVDITTSGASGGSFKDGNVTVIGGSTTGATVSVLDGTNFVNLSTGSSIYLGNITATGAGAGNGGNVTIASAAPNLINGPMVINSLGVITGSSFFFPGTLAGGNITQSATGGIFGVVADGGISMRTNGSIAVQSLTSNGLVNALNNTNTALVSTTDGINMQAGGNITINGSTQANYTTAGSGNITLNATLGSILYGGNVVSSMGNVTMNAGGAIEGLNHDTATISANTGLSGQSAWQFLLGATYDSANGFLYVPDTGFNATGGTQVAVINTATNTQVAVINGFTNPEGTAVSKDGSLLFVANGINAKTGLTGPQTVSIVSTTSNSVIGTASIPVADGNPETVAVSPDGKTLYVVSDKGTFTTNGAGQVTLSIFNISTPSTPTLVSTKSLGTAIPQTGGIVLNPQGTTAYISCSGTKNVYAVNVSNPLSIPQPQVINLNIPSLAKESPFFLAMDPNGNRLYVAESFLQRTPSVVIEGGIAVINVTPGSSTFNEVVATTQLPQSSTAGAGSFPQGIAVNATGTELYSQATYLPYLFSTYTGVNQTIEYIPLSGSNAGPDGFGSSAFSTVITTNGVPQITTYSSNTQNLEGPANTVSVITKPTVQCGLGQTIALTTTSGDILTNVDPHGGFLSIKAGGSGAVMVNDVGSNVGGTTVTAGVAASNLFEIGSVETLTITGAINSPTVILQTTDAVNPGAGIVIGNTVGVLTGSTTLATGSGNISETTNGLVVGKSVSITSLSGNVDGVSNVSTPVNVTYNGFGFNPTSLTTGLGPLRVTSVTDTTTGGNTLVAGTDYSFDDTSNTITWLTLQAVNANDSIDIKTTQPFQVQTSSLSVITGGAGNAYIHNSGALTLSNSAAGGTLQVTSTPLPTSNTAPVTITGAIAAPIIDIRSVGTISIGAQIGTSNVGNGTSVNLDTGGVGAITNTKGTFEIVADTLNLSAGSGGVGTAAAPLRTDVTTLGQVITEIFSGAGGVFITNTGALNVGGASGSGIFSGGTVSLTSSGTLTVDQLIAEASVVNLTATLGDIDISASLGASPETLISVGSKDTLISTNGNIFDTSGSYVRGASVTLQAKNGAIGTSGDVVNTTATSLTVNADAGAYLNGSDDSLFPAYIITVNKSSVTGAGGTFSLTTSTSEDNESDIKVAGAITANNVILSTNTAGTNGAVLLDANVGTVGHGSTEISTGSVINSSGINPTVGNAIIFAGGAILSPTVTLTSAYGNIGSSTKPITLNAGTGNTAALTVDAGNTPAGFTTGPSSSAYVSATGSVDLTGSNSAAATFQLKDTGTTLNVTGSVTAATINLNAGGAENVVSTGTGLTGTNINLTSGTGNIGVPGGGAISVGGLASAAGTVSATTGGFGSVYLTPTTAETIAASTTGSFSVSHPGSGTFQMTNGTNGLTVSGLIKAPIVDLGDSGNISLGNGIGTGAGTVTLDSSAGNLIWTATASTALINGTSVSLTGNKIGTSGSLVALKMATTGLLTLSTGGNAFINVESGNADFANTSLVGGSTLSIANTTGALSVNGTISGTPTEIDLNAKTNLTPGATIFALATPQTLKMIAGGVLTLPSSLTTLAVAANPVSGHGGTLTIEAASVVEASSVTFNADATQLTTNGAGGTINFTITGGQSFGVGNQLVFSATGAWDGSTPGAGGTGGTIIASTGGNLTVSKSGVLNAPTAGGGGAGGISTFKTGGKLTLPDTGTSLSVVGDSGGTDGSISLTAGSTLSVAGDLNAGTTGTVDLFAKGASFQIGSASGVPTNGIQGNIFATDIQVSNPTGVTLNNTLGAVNVPSSVEFDTGVFTNNGSLSNLASASTLTIKSTGSNLALAGTTTGSAWGPSQTVKLISSGNLNTGLAFSGGATGVFGDAYNVTIQAGGVLTAGANTLSALPPSGYVSSLTVSAKSITLAHPGFLTLQSFNQASNLAGIVSLTLTGTDALTLGTASGNVSIDVATGGPPVNAGSITVSNGGAVTVNSGGISTTAGGNTNVSLSAGGALVWNGFTQALVGTGANLSFTSKSSNAFTIGSGTIKNGIQLLTGQLTTSVLSITNNGGSIGISGTPVQLDVSNLALNAGPTGLVNVVDSASSVTLNNSSAGTSFALSVPTGSTLSQAGGTTIATKTLTISAGTLGAINTNATSVNITSITGTSATVNDSSTSPVTIVGFSVPLGGTSTFTSGGNIIVQTTFGDTSGTANLTTGPTGSIVETGGAFISGATVNLNAGTGGIGTAATALVVDAPASGAQTLSLNATGLVNVNDNSTNTVNLSGAAAGSTFTLGTPGTLQLGNSVSYNAPAIVLTAAGLEGNVTTNATNIKLNVTGFVFTGVSIIATSSSLVTLNQMTLPSQYATSGIFSITDFGGALKIAAGINAFNTTINGASDVTIAAVVGGSTTTGGVMAPTPGSMTLVNMGGGTLSTSSGVTGTGLIVGDTVTLESDEGSFNANLGTANSLVHVMANSITANTPGPTVYSTGYYPLNPVFGGVVGGSVGIMNFGGTGSVNLGASVSGADFTFVDASQGGVTITGPIVVGAYTAGTVNGATNNFTLMENGFLNTATSVFKTGNINVNSNITVNGGSAVIQSVGLNGVNAQGEQIESLDGSIVFGSHVTVATNVTAPKTDQTIGQISILIGDAPQAPTGPHGAGLPVGVGYIEENGGAVFTGASPTSITSSGNSNLLTADGANVILNVATTGTPGTSVVQTVGGTIQFSSSDSITADPVVSPSAGFAAATGAFDSAALPGAGALAGGGLTRVLPISPAQQLSWIAPTVSNGIGASLFGTSALTADQANAAVNVSAAAGGQAVPNQSLATQASANQATATQMNSAITGAISDEGQLLAFAGAPAVAPSMLSGDLDHVRVFDGDPQSSCANGSASDLNSGTTLVAPRKETVLRTPFGTIHVAAGAVVLVVLQSNKAVSIFDLHDNHAGDVRLDGSNQVVLTPGKHVTIAATKDDDFATVNPFDVISHRDMQSKQNRAFTIFSSDFSIPSAIKGLDISRALQQSASHADAHLTDAMLRDAAILMQLHATSTPYKRMGSKRPASKLAFSY